MSIQQMTEIDRHYFVYHRPEEPRRGEHIAFALNREGDHENAEFFPFLHRWIFQIAPAFKNVGKHDLGQVVSYFDEENYQYYHGIVVFSIDPEFYWRDSYDAIVTSLDHINEEFEETLTWPIRLEMPGMASRALQMETGPDLFKNLEAIAASQAETNVYYCRA